MSRRKIVLSLDESKESHAAIGWIMRNVYKEHSDELHLLHVLPDTPAVIPATMMPAAMPVLSGSSVVSRQWEEDKRYTEQAALQTLSSLVHTINDEYKVPKEGVHTHLVPAIGGASGVAESITEFVKKNETDLLILASRGMGAFRRACMSFIGLGSVSDYCLHNCPVPTLVVKFPNGVLPSDAPLPDTPEPKRIVVSTDGSSASKNALAWAVSHLVQPQDTLHIISIACPAVYPVMDLPMSVGVLQAQAERASSRMHTQVILDEGMALAVKQGVQAAQIITKVMEPDTNGAAEVGECICTYAKDQGSQLIVSGCRGLGAMSRSMMGIVGLGSVSDYLVHNGPCAMLVVKNRIEPPSRKQGTEQEDKDA